MGVPADHDATLVEEFADLQQILFDVFCFVFQKG
jgi:hypothetical protein